MHQKVGFNGGLKRWEKHVFMGDVVKHQFFKGIFYTFSDMFFFQSL